MAGLILHQVTSGRVKTTKKKNSLRILQLDK